MQLARYQVSTLRPPPILGVTFAHDSGIFTVATETGYEVWRTYPLGLVRRRSELWCWSLPPSPSIPSTDHPALAGTLARAVPLPASPLIVLQGGGANPLFPPNKAVLYHDGLGAPVAELEFRCEVTRSRDADLQRADTRNRSAPPHRRHSAPPPRVRVRVYYWQGGLLGAQDQRVGDGRERGWWVASGAL